jgi:serine/threonine protein kinase
VDHPCILRRFDVYHEKSDLFVEMEYASGGSLFDRIHKIYIMTEDECKFIFYQIACALAYLHRLKIVKYFLFKTCLLYACPRFIEI